MLEKNGLNAHKRALKTVVLGAMLNDIAQTETVKSGYCGRMICVAINVGDIGSVGKAAMPS
jgi:hypothetical protein